MIIFDEDIESLATKKLITSSISKIWYSFAELGAYASNNHFDRCHRFSTWSFKTLTRDPNGIQSDIDPDNRGLVSIPTPVCADTLGSAPE